ncbi:BZ3500_MvSof-1268-A1-R1_Chr3-1g05900 [Microbotryum saponariae]|uniref:BZ3500_MvSof-1268-A1-R1_Chr3-1g05900 protein n=1 Tax=Microbotryum saponariae TaxID=289078 RepID=A0A2X0LIU1_9BASI|nr:BZ3500_MvSof-1268-A1-R1_Chr3-1g05900 [Microbotryum saponariae]SDA05090.1 BZ3501_MvSof-1269-A2-R1_Chr3-1g05570 [Microbotryum saponariae]
MGLSSLVGAVTGKQSAPMNLAAVTPPIGLNPHFIKPTPVVLVMAESRMSFSGDDFTIKDSNGVHVLKCSGRAMSFKDKKDFKDPQNNFLFSLREKTMAIHKTQLIEDGSGKDLCKLVKKISIGGSKYIAEFNNLVGDGRPVELKCRGNLLGGAADILYNDRVVVQISRQMLNMREAMGGKQTYYTTVAPGFDVSLAAALTIAWDEFEHDEK